MVRRWQPPVAGRHQGVDAETGQEIFTLLGHLDSVLGVTFSPDGRRLASAGADGAIVLWDLVTGEQEMTLQVAAKW